MKHTLHSKLLVLATIGVAVVLGPPADAHPRSRIVGSFEIDPSVMCTQEIGGGLNCALLGSVTATERGRRLDVVDTFPAPSVSGQDSAVTARCERRRRTLFCSFEGSFETESSTVVFSAATTDCTEFSTGRPSSGPNRVQS